VRFGQTRFAIDTKGTGLLGPWLTFVGLSLFLPFMPFVAATFYLADSAKDLVGLASLQSWHELFAQNKELLVVGLVTLLAALSSVPMLYTWYRVREFRYFARTIKFKDCAFTSALTARHVIGLVMLTMLAITVALLVVDAPIAFLGKSLGLPNALNGIVLFVVTLVVLQVVQAVIFQFGLFARICATFTLSDPAPFERAVQSAAAGPATGEGFADALDVGGF
jgi:hypothetical protein